MKKLMLSDLIQPLEAELRGNDTLLGAINTDTRTVAPGECFLALKGPNFNGHHYVEAAKNKGATALIIDEEVVCELPTLKVEDTLSALTEVSRYFRSQFQGKTVALTGSCGKTTVKTMIATILQYKGEVLATEGTKNNHIGVPLTLLRLQDKHDYAVIEIGTNHFGEIKPLTELTRPDIALITNARAVHLEGLKSIAGVAQEKGDIFLGLGPTGTMIIPSTDDYTPYWRNLQDKNQKCMTFGRDMQADVRGSDIVRQENHINFKCHIEGKSIDITLPLLGDHNVNNALAAAAVCYELGCSLEEIKNGLEHAQPVSGRLVQRTGLFGVKLIDDTYNANPTAVMEAIRVLSETTTPEKWLVLGDMAELGSHAEAFHREIGVNSKLFGVTKLLTIGEWSQQASYAYGDGAKHYDSQADLIQALQTSLTEQRDNVSQISILVKGSRSAGMENVVQQLLETETESVTC